MEGLDAASWAEAGNIRYDYFFPAEDNGDLLLMEKWQDGEAFSKHCKEPHFKRLGELKDEFVEETVLEKFEA